jgi:hypothetical protein
MVSILIFYGFIIGVVFLLMDAIMKNKINGKFLLFLILMYLIFFCINSIDGLLIFPFFVFLWSCITGDYVTSRFYKFLFYFYLGTLLVADYVQNQGVDNAGAIVMLLAIAEAVDNLRDCIKNWFPQKQKLKKVKTQIVSFKDWFL